MREQELATSFGKTRLAATVSAGGFRTCRHSGAFLAYYTSRFAMRTVFTSGSQQRPANEVAEALLVRALDCACSHPDVVEAVLTRRRGSLTV